MIVFAGNFRTVMNESRQEARQQALEESDLRWQVKTLPVLHQIDKTFASVANELVKNHCSEDVFAPFNDSWDELKRLIRNIQRENNHDEQKN